jgi:hypothetical protein
VQLMLMLRTSVTPLASIAFSIFRLLRIGSSVHSFVKAASNRRVRSTV